MAQHINTAGIELIKRFEGCRLEAYADAVGVWTIGYGHTREVKQGDVCTQWMADNWLMDDILWAEQEVASLVTGMETNANQFSALVSLCYNIGGKQFGKSTLLKKLNVGDIDGAAGQFRRWNKAGQDVLEGLVRRRQAEEELFRRPIRPLSRSRTLAGGQIATAGVGLEGLAQGLQDSQSMLYGLAPYLPWARYALLVVIVAGVGIMLWARLSDHLKAVR